MRKREYLGGACSALALLLSHSAQAQSVAGDGQVTEQLAPDATQVDEIVVTALKTSASLQNVAAAVSVLDGESLAAQGVVNLVQIPNLSTGVTIAPLRNTQALVFIRGVGVSLSTPNTDPAVAINLNGVYVPMEMSGAAFFDLERVEILPGPQGTLYGRNSTGGVVNVASRKPRDVFGANASLELSNYNTVLTTLGVDVPLTTTVSSRTAGTFNRRDGYFNNGEDDADTWAIRETLMWRPQEETTVTAVASYTYAGGLGNVLQNLPDIGCGYRCATFDPQALGYFNRVKVFQGSVQVEHAFSDALSLTYIGGYNRLTLDTLNSLVAGPGPVVPLTNNQVTENQSHEVRLNATLGRLDGLLGVYVFDQDAFFGGNIQPVPGVRVEYPFDGSTRGSAVFGQGTYALADALRLTAGLRYSHTAKSIDGYNDTFIAGGLIAHNAYNGRVSYDRLDWKAGVEIDLAARSMLYASVSSGFSPGGFSTGPAVLGQLQAAPFEPVELVAYAAGLKNRFADGLLTLNAEAFYYDYKNYQVSARDVLTQQNLVYNAARATVYGAQFDARLQPTANDDLSLGLTWLHAEADVLRAGGTTANPIVYDGTRLPFSPAWAINLAYQHAFDLRNGAQVRARANVKYTSSRWDIYGEQNPLYPIDANTHTDLNLGYFAVGDRWSLQAFVRNLEDDLVKSHCTDVRPGPVGCYYEPPRTYGLALAASF